MPKITHLVKKFSSGELKVNIEFTDIPADELFSICERKNNSKRQFLFVSKVLGKHLEVSPKKMQEIYYLLSNKLQQQNIAFPALFIGMAETATCLATGIFEAFNNNNSNKNNNSFYLQSSRYKVQNCQIIDFAEEHSHAPQQYLNISKEFLQTNILNDAKTLLLVDDEISSGNTFKNVISALKNQQFLPNLQNIIYISITNFLSQESINKWQSNFSNISLKTCEILRGNYSFQTDLNNQNLQKFSIVKKDFSKNIVLVDNFFGRCGLNTNLNNEHNFFKKNIQNLVENCYKNILNNLQNASSNENSSKNSKYKILILGSGEFMFFPYKFSLNLQQVFKNNVQNNIEVLFKATTRSPIFTTFSDKNSNENSNKNSKNIIQNQIAFLDNYGEGIDNYLYNLKNHSYNQIILCVETEKNNIKSVKNIVRKLKNNTSKQKNCIFQMIFFGGETYEICDFY